jgi:hypothetical protein
VDGRETLVLAIRRRRIALPGHDDRNAPYPAIALAARSAIRIVGV